MSRVVSVRFEDHEWEAVASAAAVHGMPFSTYCRQRLLASDDLQHQLTQLAVRLDELTSVGLGKMVEKGSSIQATGDSDRDTWPIIVEILLMLRFMAKPETSKAVGGELERNGISPFSIQN